VPLLTITEAEPLEDPHDADVVFVFADMAIGSLTLAEAVCVQPLASVTVTLYDPARRFVAVEELPPEGNHE
jgi:hypothetical protein